MQDANFIKKIEMDGDVIKRQYAFLKNHSG